jgi:hypothetical protein
VVRLQALLALCGSVVGVLLTQWATVQNDLAHAMKMRLCDAIGSKPVLVLASVFRQHGSTEVIWLALPRC